MDVEDALRRKTEKVVGERMLMIPLRVASSDVI